MERFFVKNGPQRHYSTRTSNRHCVVADVPAQASCQPGQAARGVSSYFKIFGAAASLITWAGKRLFFTRAEFNTVPSKNRTAYELFENRLESAREIIRKKNNRSAFVLPLPPITVESLARKVLQRRHCSNKMLWTKCMKDSATNNSTIHVQSISSFSNLLSSSTFTKGSACKNSWISAVVGIIFGHRCRHPCRWSSIDHHHWCLRTVSNRGAAFCRYWILLLCLLPLLLIRRA